MGRYDYDDMPSASNGRRGRGSRTTALVALICILLVLIGIVIYLILFSPSTTMTVQEKPGDSSQSIIEVPVDVTPEVPPVNESDTVVEVADSNEVEPLAVEVPEVSEEILPDDVEEILAVETEEELVDESSEFVELQSSEVVEDVEVEEASEVEGSNLEEPVTEEYISEEFEVVEEIEEPKEPEEVFLEELVEETTSEEILVEDVPLEEVVLESSALEEPESLEEEVVLPVPFMDAETLHNGLMEVLSRMNLDPIPMEEEETIVEPDPIEVILPEIVEIEESVVNVFSEEEEPEVVEEEIFATYDFVSSIENAVLVLEDTRAVLTGKAGQGVKSFVSGTVLATGKVDGEKYIDVLSEDGRTIHYCGFERVSVKKSQQVTEGTVLGSIGSSSHTPFTISIVVLDEDGNTMNLQ